MAILLPKSPVLARVVELERFFVLFCFFQIQQAWRTSHFNADPLLLHAYVGPQLPILSSLYLTSKDTSARVKRSMASYWIWISLMFSSSTENLRASNNPYSCPIVWASWSKEDFFQAHVFLFLSPVCQSVRAVSSLLPEASIAELADPATPCYILKEGFTL